VYANHPERPTVAKAARRACRAPFGHAAIGCGRRSRGLVSPWTGKSYEAYPITINPLEIERDQPSYTIDTVRTLRKSAPDTRFIWLIGSDQLANFHTWRDWRDILTYTHIAVAQRAGHEISYEQLSDPQLCDYYRQNHCDVTAPFSLAPTTQRPLHRVPRTSHCRLIDTDSRTNPHRSDHTGHHKKCRKIHTRTRSIQIIQNFMLRRNIKQ